MRENKLVLTRFAARRTFGSFSLQKCGFDVVGLRCQSLAVMGRTFQPPIVPPNHDHRFPQLLAVLSLQTVDVVRNAKD